MKLEKGLCQYATFENTTCQFFDMYNEWALLEQRRFHGGIFGGQHRESNRQP